MSCPSAAVGEQRLQLGAEKKRAVRERRVVERLDAEPVAREEERLPVAVPEREREHAAEALDAALAPRLPRMHDHLGVALRAEGVAEPRELGNERLVVVDLAVEDDARRCRPRCRAAAARWRGR